MSAELLELLGPLGDAQVFSLCYRRITGERGRASRIEGGRIGTSSPSLSLEGMWITCRNGDRYAKV